MQREINSKKRERDIQFQLILFYLFFYCDDNEKLETFHYIHI